MKHIFSTIVACMLTTAAWAQQSWSTNVTANTLVPDNDFNGLASSFSVSGLSGAISYVTVTLDVTGGYNGDLYASLVGLNGGFAVLLNRIGVGAANTNGYSDAGFNITLSDSAANGNIHDYELVLNPSGGQLTGIWAPDGRNIDPQSAASAFDSAAVTATLSSFIGNGANGTWGFFIADLSPGGQSTLVSYGVTILTVPEPQTWMIAGMAALFGGFMFRDRFRCSGQNR